MRYPKMQTQPKATVTVPQLNGGVNLCDLPNHVNDNQLTACNNVWWYNGMLQTRPGLTVKQEGTLPVGATGAVAHFTTGNPVNERETLLGQFRAPPDGATDGTFWGYSLDLDNGVTCLGQRMNVAPDKNGGWSAMGVKAGKCSDTHYYCFLSDGSVLQQGKVPTDGSQRQLVDAEPYAPLVMVNGHPVETEEELNTQGPNGVLFESYNMLTGKYRCGFTTDGKSHYFRLPAPEGTYPKVIAAQYTFYNQVTSRVETINLYSDEKYDPAAFGIVQEGQDYVMFSFNTHNDAGAPGYGDAKRMLIYIKVYNKNGENIVDVDIPAAPDNNNLILTLEADGSGYRDTICRMKRCTWFGGDRSGVDGGTRLFVCGNPDKPNLVHWSDVNNPLYFPENNYAYIGSGDEAVTGFGKQGDLLVMFKEHELYAAQYVEGTDFTYEDVISGKITDVAAHLAQFPITPLHPSIGCDCPDTIRLVNNKLVWATSNRHIYMLTGVNQWSERNVRDITARIRPHLDKQDTLSLKKATAGEYRGYYTLLVGRTMYLMDTGNSAFQSYAYYANEKKATMALPWYIWELDNGTDAWVTTVSDDEQLYILKQPAYAPLYGGQEWTLYTLGGDTDDGAAIESSFTTKLYDFARVDVKKSIDQVYISAGDTEGCRIRVGYVTDRYTVQDAYVIECTGETGGSIQPYGVTPNVRMVQRSAPAFSAENAMSVSGLTIKYKNQGVVR